MNLLGVLENLYIQSKGVGDRGYVVCADNECELSETGGDETNENTYCTANSGDNVGDNVCEEGDGLGKCSVKDNDRRDSVVRRKLNFSD